METIKKRGKIKLSITIARVCGIFAIISLIGAWITQITGGSILGMSQQHLFFDSIALSLISIGNFIDSLLHSRNLPK